MAHPSSDSTVDGLFGDMTPEQFYEKHGVKHSEKYITNSRGMKLYTHSWIPTKVDAVKGLVMVCHGYGADSGWFVQLTAIGIAEKGFSVHAIDHQGHGRSEDLQGLRAYVPDINPIVDDCIAFFDSVRKENDPGLPCFLYGESLGGAICLLIHLKQPSVWRGAVLNGAMCGISPKFKPPWPLENLLWYVAAVAPTWPVVPTKDIATVSFKEAWKRELVKKNPVRYSGKPRAGTALELLRVVKELESRFPEVTIPLLVIHGELDVVTDPEGSKALYERCSSSDKTLRIHEGMWHQLAGEPPENVERVFGEVYKWLEERA